MQGAEKGVAKVVGMIARRDAAVAWSNRGEKRMRRGVESAALKVEAEPSGRHLVKVALAADRKGAA